MALSYRPATPVRDPAALALFATASERTRGFEPAAASRDGVGRERPPRPGPLAGLIAIAVAVVVIAAPVAVAGAAGRSDRGCAVVPYVLDARWGPPAAAQLVEDVLGEIEEMSGVRFERATAVSRTNAAVRLAWLAPGAQVAWDRLQLGWATARWDRRGRFETLITGEVMFRSPSDAEHILQGPVDWHTIARHEIGHLLGLPHQGDPGDVMHPRLTGAAQLWTATDRAHLATRGQATGCR